MIQTQKHLTLLRAVLYTMILLCTAACGGEEDNRSSLPPNEAYWKISSTVKATESSLAIIITGVPGVQWSAGITEGAAWCSFSSKDLTYTSKTGIVNEGLNVLYVYYKANAEKEQRQATISFRFAEEAVQTFNLVQLAESQQNLPPFGGWAELPAKVINTNYQYVTHYVALNSKEVRNYSICFDKTKKAALWVAYPLHKGYTSGNGGRTDAWAFDPFILDQYQPNLEKSYKGNYDRGHQLPSADRQASKEMNAQTFYFSNMTPQLDRLNQDMWAKLEAKVRQNECSDTLYVVTGAYFGSGAITTTDGAGGAVPVPTNYFKVLLRTRAGSTGKAIKDCSAEELISIGFWVEQKSYGNIEPPRSICTSVTDIEQKTGFSFFPQVPATVKQQKNPTQWGIN